MLHEGPWYRHPRTGYEFVRRVPHATGLALDHLEASDQHTEKTAKKILAIDIIVSCGRARPQALRLRRTASRLRGLTARLNP